jgi:hypothetical protein
MSWRAVSWTALLACALPGAAVAQPPSGAPRFEYRIGAQIFSSFDSVLRLDSATRGVGTELRLEDDVDLEERIHVGRADGAYHFNERHHVAFAAYDVDRTGTRRIARDIRFGDETFAIDTSVHTALEERIMKVSYGYAPLVRPRGKLGPTFGLHVMQLAAGMGIASEPQVDDAKTTAPLPVLGIRGNWRFAPRWRLVGGYEWFDVEVGDAQGVFSDFIVSVEHDTFDRFGFGAGINNLSLDVESGDDDFRGAIDLSFRSIVVYFKGTLGAAPSRNP